MEALCLTNMWMEMLFLCCQLWEDKQSWAHTGASRKAQCCFRQRGLCSAWVGGLGWGQGAPVEELFEVSLCEGC